MSDWPQPGPTEPDIKPDALPPTALPASVAAPFPSETAAAAPEPVHEATVFSATAFTMETSPSDATITAKPGDVLNHAFEVHRFIARGGMGEVFEGRNLVTGEKVAIKAILPDKAADPKVVEMFLREAETLTRLSHDALVKYRMQARDPTRNLLYLVTEYIDGVQLGDVLGSMAMGEAEQVALLRRLAAGLATAHGAGAVHRDIAPDNIMIIGGRLETAKIIDFGIAKDLTVGTGTIIGDGLAGKLSYMSPEQLGDFDRQIGPWSDVYSLGLVMLAVANRQHVKMGGTFVNAVNSRRSVPDLASVPDRLRPVLTRMLEPDPANRLRSMEEVIAALDAPASPPAKAGKAAKPAKALERGTSDPKPESSRPKWLLPAAGGGVALLLIGGFVLFGGDRTSAPAAAPTTVAEAPAAAVAPSLPRLQAVAERSLGQTGCSWLNLESASLQGTAPQLRLTGVAADQAAVQRQLDRSLRAARFSGASINLDDVSRIAPGACAFLDDLRALRAPGEPSLRSTQLRYEQSIQQNSTYGSRPVARTVLEMDTGAGDFVLLGVEPSGKVLLAGTADEVKQASDKLGPGRYRVQTDVTETGWNGVILMKGPPGFRAALLAVPGARQDANWSRDVLAEARRLGWTTDMVWFEVVNNVPG